VDVWLNTPLRPLEASGTSGMKALANGVLNLSTLDGWWDEAWIMGGEEKGGVGWAIGRGETFPDPQYQDQVEAEALYNLLERDVVPTFYDRKADGLPRRWIELMKSSLGTLCHRFNTHRMVREYVENAYLTAHANHRRLMQDNAAPARSLAASLARIRAAWKNIRLEIVNSELPADVPVGESIRCRARLHPASLSPDDLFVELYMGRLNADGEIVNTVVARMTCVGKEGDALIYEATAMPPTGSGRHGYTARALPNHPELQNPFVPGLITWAT